jgi:hypothetical protein
MTTRLKERAQQVKPMLLLNQGLSMNELLILQYKAETGCTIFRTFKAWKDQGFSVKKGEKGFPIFSRPIAAIKAEQGKEASPEENKFFGTCYLFNENQVEKK